MKKKVFCVKRSQELSGGMMLIASDSLKEASDILINYNKEDSDSFLKEGLEEEFFFSYLPKNLFEIPNLFFEGKSGIIEESGYTE